MSKVAERFPGVLDLPDEAKLQLAGELFADVIGDDGQRDPALLARIEERLAEYLEHPERTSSWQEIKARLSKKEG